MLDGYLTAIVVGPCSISLDEWFVDMLGVNGHIGSAHGQHLAALMAVVARFNAIGQTPSETPDKNAPIFKLEDNGTTAGCSRPFGARVSRGHAPEMDCLAARARPEPY